MVTGRWPDAAEVVSRETVLEGEALLGDLPKAKPTASLSLWPRVAAEVELGRDVVQERPPAGGVSRARGVGPLSVRC